MVRFIGLLASAVCFVATAQAQTAVEIPLSGTLAADCNITEAPGDTELSTSQPVGSLVGIGNLKVECNTDGPWQIRFGSKNGNYLVNESYPAYQVRYATAWAGFGGTGCCGFQPPGAPGAYGPWFNFTGFVVTGTYSVRLDEPFPNIAGRYSDVQYIEVSP